MKAGRTSPGLLVVCALCCAYDAPAVPVPFAAPSIVSTNTDGARFVTGADVDGDGDLDLLSASEFDHRVAWHENNGAAPPGFTLRLVATNALGASFVVAADLDRDGDVDLISSSLSDNKIAWYENNGGSPPAFSNRTISSSAIGARSVHAADLDRDGDLDVLSASFSDNRITWYENNGAAPPGFTTRTITTNASGAFSVFAEDLDRDGDLDVLSASLNDNKIAWYPNNGASPPAFTTNLISTSAIGAQSVYAMDLDHDGDVDVLSASRSDDRIAWYENNGAAPPVFTTRTITASAAGARSVFAADLDHDGDVDALSASLDDNTVAWYENDGMAPPGFVTNIISAAVQGANAVQAADVDGDGDLDVLSAAYLGDRVLWHENRTIHRNAAFPLEEIVMDNGIASSIRDVFAADVNGDGIMDLMSASSGDDKIAWYAGASNGLPGYFQNVVDIHADGAQSVWATNIDGDLDMDIVAGSGADKTVAWYENQGGDFPAFTKHVISTLVPEPEVSAGDINGDGLVDLFALAEEFGGKMEWYRNLGGNPPAFQTNTVFSFQFDAAPREAVLADVNGDTNLDVIAIFFNQLRWYENSGGLAPSFTVHTNATSLAFGWAVNAGDVDGDGDTDLVASSLTPGRIEWYENNGADPPTFASHLVYSTGSVPQVRSVAFADVNGDGDEDILAALSGFSVTNGILWFESDGGMPPVFTPHPQPASSTSVRARAADLGGDSDLDLYSAADTRHRVEWLESDGVDPPSFIKHFTSEALVDLREVFAVDLDQDGDTDLLSAAQNFNAISDDAPLIAWHENDGMVPPRFRFHSIFTSTNNAGHVTAADVDGDGDLDVLSGLVQDGVQWHENTGGSPPVFTNHHVIARTGDNEDEVVATDLDGDGDLDAVVTGSFSLQWYEGDGGSPPAFTTNLIAFRTFFTGIAAADVDGDGDHDIIASSAGGPQLELFVNDGGAPPAFTTNELSNAMGDNFSPTVADLDGDGDLDIVTANSSSSTLQWYENLGGQPAAFTKHMAATNVGYLRDANVADLDVDGDLDILASANVPPNFTNDYTWYENDGAVPPGFVRRFVANGFSQRFSVLAADLDGDGDPDLVSGALQPDRLAWYENRGGQFSLATANTAPAALLQGQTNDLLAITMKHEGRVSDTDEELVSLALRFEEAPGDPLSGAEANALIERLRIFLDTGSGQFEASADTLVATVDPLVLNGGTQVVSFADGNANVRVQHGTPRTYFAVMDLTTNAHAQTPRRFQLTHLTEYSSTAEDRNNDIPLALAFVPDRTSTMVLAISPTSDEDGDGMPDFWEQDQFAHPTNASTSVDAEGDGMKNIEEYVADTIPTNGASYFRVNDLSGTVTRVVAFPSSTARLYRLQYATNLLVNAWANIGGVVTGAPSGVTTIPDSGAGTQRIYRVNVQLP